MNTKPKTHDCAGLVLTEDKKLLAYGLCVGVVVQEQELAKLRRDAAELRAMQRRAA